MKKFVRNFLNGAAFGVTQIVPGVSGGTIAIILGFYSELLKSVNNLLKNFKESFRFLFPLFLGAAAGIFAFASLVNFLLEKYSFPSMTFFIGLIAGIIPVIYSKIKEPGKKISLKQTILILIPALILFLIDYLKNRNPAENIPDISINNIDIFFMIFIFFTGIIAAAALIIPGISGSFVFLLFGVYPLITSAISSAAVWLYDVSNTELFINICKILAPLLAGIIIGIILTAKIIEKLLRDYYKIIYSAILGLLLGSVYALFRDPIVYRSGVNPAIIAVGALTLLCGAAVSYVLGKKRF
ncbi:MAG: DUF368 domain-containing protein [Oscillospiraceae bacterium]|nr:DUF368 domain-containing protein [Oscillospiraceae bacterium]